MIKASAPVSFDVHVVVELSALFGKVLGAEEVSPVTLLGLQLRLAHRLLRLGDSITSASYGDLAGAGNTSHTRRSICTGNATIKIARDNRAR